MSIYGALLNAARKKAGMSISRLAREIERSEAHMREVEKGTRGPLGLDDTRKVARALGIPARELLEAMVRDRGKVELVVPPDGPRFELAVRLLERWDLMRDEEMGRLVREA